MSVGRFVESFLLPRITERHRAYDNGGIEGGCRYTAVVVRKIERFGSITLLSSVSSQPRLNALH